MEDLEKQLREQTGRVEGTTPAAAAAAAAPHALPSLTPAATFGHLDSGKVVTKNPTTPVSASHTVAPGGGGSRGRGMGQMVGASATGHGQQNGVVAATAKNVVAAAANHHPTQYANPSISVVKVGSVPAAAAAAAVAAAPPTRSSGTGVVGPPVSATAQAPAPAPVMTPSVGTQPPTSAVASCQHNTEAETTAMDADKDEEEMTVVDVGEPPKGPTPNEGVFGTTPVAPAAVAGVGRTVSAFAALSDSKVSTATAATSSPSSSPLSDDVTIDVGHVDVPSDSNKIEVANAAAPAASSRDNNVSDVETDSNNYSIATAAAAATVTAPTATTTSGSSGITSPRLGKGDGSSISSSGVTGNSTVTPAASCSQPTSLSISATKPSPSSGSSTDSGRGNHSQEKVEPVVSAVGQAVAPAAGMGGNGALSNKEGTDNTGKESRDGRVEVGTERASGSDGDGCVALQHGDGGDEGMDVNEEDNDDDDAGVLL